MKKTILGLLLLLSTLAFGKTTITGIIVNPSGSPLNGTIEFYLPFAGVKNIADPACPSCPIIFQGPSKFPVINGHVVGNNRNVPPGIIANGDGYPGLTYYQVIISDSIAVFSQKFNIYVPSGATFDIGAAFQTQITTTNLSFPPLVTTTSIPGTFIDPQVTAASQVLVNGCSPGTEYQALEGAHGDTVGYAGCVAVPVGSTVHEANGLFGVATGLSPATNTVGVRGQARALANNVNVFAGVFAASDGGFISPEVIGHEVDIQSLNVGSNGAGILFNGTLQPGNTFSAILIPPATAVGAQSWFNGLSFNAASGVFCCKYAIHFTTGATPSPSGSSAAISFEPLAAGVNQASQGEVFTGNDPVAGQNTAEQNADANGSMHFQFSNPIAGLYSDGFISGTKSICTGPFSSPSCMFQNNLGQLVLPPFVVQSDFAGNWNYVQGPPSFPAPNSVNFTAPQTVNVNGYNVVLPSNSANGMLSALQSTGGTGTVTCAGCGSLATGSINIITPGAYATIPACLVSPPNTIGGVQATCSVQALSNTTNGGLSGGAASVIIVQPGTGYTANATLTFSNDVDMFIGAPFAVDLLAQHALIGATAIPNPQGGAHTISIGQSGQYRLTWDAKVTTAAGVSSTLGGLTIVYTDPDGTTQTIPAIALNSAGAMVLTATTNTTTTFLIGMPLMLNCASNTDVTYTMNYASNAAAAMAYNLHIRLEPF